MQQLLALLLILIAAATAARADGGASPAASCWQRLAYGAGDGWLTGRTTIDYTLVEAPAPLVTRAGTTIPVVPADSRVVRLAARFEAMQSRGEFDAWYLRGTDRLVATRRLGQGRESRLKLHQFTADGVLRERRQPAGDAAKAPPERWPVRSSVVLKAPAAARAGPVTTPLQLLEQAARVVREPAAANVERIVFTDRQWYAVRLLPGEPTQVEEDFDLHEGNAKRRIHRRAGVRPVRIEARLLGDAPEHEHFRLLEMDGPLIIHVDPELGLPVRIQGSWMRVGSMPVDLSAAVLAKPPCPAS